VRFQGNGIAGIKLLLRQCPTSGGCDLTNSKVAETTTGANGYYQFLGVPSLPAGSNYFVFYYNHNDGGNIPDDRFLWRWYTPYITSYSAGSSVPGGDIDLDDVTLTEPRTDRTSLPVTFSWNPRNEPGEHYSWELFDLQSGATMCVSSPTTGNSVGLSEAELLGPCGGTYGVQYGWFVWALAGPAWDNNEGFGDSYYYAAITFEGSGPPTATPTPTATRRPPTPTPTPTATPPTGPSISGRLTARGAGVSGVLLQLLRCNPWTCDLQTTTTSGTNGNYLFSDVAPLAGGETYVVRYTNGPTGGNPQNPNYLAYWVTGGIAPAAAQTGAISIDLDIWDVVLQEPPHGSFLWLPQTFRWAGRGVSGDHYSWTIAWLGTELCGVNPPAAATSFTLDVASATGCGLFAGTVYDWYVYVTKGPSFDNGFGLSYYYRQIGFLGARGAREPRLLETPRSALEAPLPDLPEGLIPEVER
jgi:hypothetical protein